MSDLKRNLIELITNPEEVAGGGEVETKKYWTPPFIPLKLLYQALDLVQEIDDFNSGKSKTKESKLIEKMGDFVANDIYQKQFTREQLENGLHAPDAVANLQEQITFISQGRFSKAAKEFQARKD